MKRDAAFYNETQQLQGQIIQAMRQTRPEVIQGLHERFLAAGADGLKTDSFGGAGHILREFDLEARTFELNRSASR